MRNNRANYGGQLPVDEILFLRSRGLSCEKIGRKLGRARNSIEYMLARLGVGSFRRVRTWTPIEDEILSKLWRAGTPTREIALQLPGRTESQVSGRRRRLKNLPARQPNRRHYFTTTENAIIEELWPTQTPSQIATKLGRTLSSVHGHGRSKLGLPTRNELKGTEP
jgi:hypothetical protein